MAPAALGGPHPPSPLPPLEGEVAPPKAVTVGFHLYNGRQYSPAEPLSLALLDS